MIGEIDLYGILLPPLLVWLGVALVASAVLRRGLLWFGVYRFVWHRPLFDLALLIILLGGISLAMNRIF